MSNLEIMDKAVAFTNEYYIEHCLSDKSTISLERAKEDVVNYSAKALISVISSSNGMSKAYTREENLRFDMASIGPDGIKNELLKNVVNVARYNIVEGTLAGKELSDRFRDNMTDNQRAVVLYNYITRNNISDAFKLLDNPLFLSSVCRTFALYRSDKEKKAILDYIARTDTEACITNESLDVYYTRLVSEKRNVNKM